MMVSISDNLNALEDDMIVKCAECEGMWCFVLCFLSEISP